MKEHIQLAPSDKELSVYGGLHFFSQSFDRLIRGSGWELGILPKTKIATQCSPIEKLKAMVLGFISGAECIDDMDRLKGDGGFVAANGGQVNAARTYDDFLQQFSNDHLRKMNLALIESGLKLHKTKAKGDDFVLSTDSTDNKQCGQKMEGLAYNYKGTWGLDTLMAFDQYGFQYWHEVRPGSTFTSNGSPELIREVFKRVPRNKHRYFLGDSGFCNGAVFNACLEQRVDFVIACRANMYERFIPLVKSWKPSQKIKFYDGRAVDIGHTVFINKETNKIMRLVVLRGLKENENGNSLFMDSRYDYAAFVTTISQHLMSNEDIISLYRSRSNAENFIRDLKYGFDMLHYPCRKLTANKAYGIMMALAYNLVRLAGHLLNPVKPLFAKAVRFLLVHIPCQVVRHGRYTTIKMPAERLKEVQRLYDKIQLSMGYESSS